MTKPSSDGQHRYTITEPSRTPLVGLLLGYAAMVPIMAGAVAVWVLPADWAGLALRFTTAWAGGTVTFLAGVRRGLSFRAPDGTTVPQIVTFLWLFCLGVAALAFGAGRAATILLLIGFVSLAVFDTAAARREEAPPYFARLRPSQMSVPVVSLLAILARLLSV